MERIEDKLSNMAPEELTKNAQHIWQMLDDMAENNPAMYRKFIDKQMCEAKKHNAKPKPHMCVHTKITAPSESGLFINILDWTRVPEPKSSEDPIPVIGSVMYDGKDNNGVYKIVTVAFSPKVTSDFGIDSHLKQERIMLINLAIDFLQDQHKCTISRHFQLLPKAKRYKGTLAKAVEAVTYRTRQQDKALDKEIGELEKMFGPLTSTDKDSLMGQLGSITDKESEYTFDDSDPSTDEEAEGKPNDVSLPYQFNQAGQLSNFKPAYGLDSPSNISKKSEPDIRLPVGQNCTKGSLIQEMRSEEALAEPDYSVCTNMGTIVVKIQLPGVTSVAECELDITESDLHLLVHKRLELALPFEQRVDKEASTAKFSKKSSTLTLTLPLL